MVSIVGQAVLTAGSLSTHVVTGRPFVWLTYSFRDCRRSSGGPLLAHHQACMGTASSPEGTMTQYCVVPPVMREALNIPEHSMR